MQLAALSSDLADCARKDVNPKYIPGQSVTRVIETFQVQDLKIKLYS
jgi:hypothetical protein